MKRNNKGRRTELTNLKYKKRLKNLGLKETDGKLYCYKSSGKPCSCSICKKPRYNRSKSKKQLKKQL